VPEGYLLQPQLFCDSPVRLEGFFDWRFNPGGLHPVITFCDGNGPERGIFDPAGAHTFPVEIALAVDLDGDGKRGAGEPILFWDGERFEDVGADGVASPQEPAYDAAANPDPAGDDFNTLGNPLGTEGNHAWDEGEPFLDFGLDGVEVTAQGPYDLGEGNCRYDLNPALQHQRDLYDPARLLFTLPADALAHLDFYLDVGAHDHYRFRPEVETFAGVLGTRERPVDLRRGFEALLPGAGGSWDVRDIDWRAVGRDLLVIYGSDDATAEQIAEGDGAHVGTAEQLIQRLGTLMAAVGRTWPDGDREPLSPPGAAQVVQAAYPSALLGEDRIFWIYLPPGYDQHPERRYPVLYLLHGIGMEPELLTASVLFIEPWMNEGSLSKFIIVFPDGRCGEDCFSGTFYVNQSGRHLPPRRYEDSFIDELIPFVDAHYRTRGPETLALP
jgi:hypothetical protein